MRAKMMWLPSVRAMTGAGVLALGLAVAWSTPTFAKGVTLDDSWLISMVASQPPDGPTVDATTGVVIVAIDVEGPAAQAGVVRGDILLKAGETEINSAAALLEVITASKPGDEVELFLHHGDEPRTLSVTLGSVATEDGGERAYLGVQVADAPTDAQAETSVTVEAVPAVAVPSVTDVQIITQSATSESAVAVPAPVLGLIVAEVMADGPAALAGLAVGDVIVAVDGVPVTTPDGFVSALQGHTPGEVVMLTVQKGVTVEAAVAEISVTLGAAPDDAMRAYLGIRILSPQATTVIGMSPSTGIFTAPAMPAMPMIPAYPEMAPGYAYPGAAVGAACSPTVINNYYYYGDSAHGAAFAAPVSPSVHALPAMPPMPNAPVYIHEDGVTVEMVRPRVSTTVSGVAAVPGVAESNVTFFRAEPVTVRGEVRRVEVQMQPGIIPALPPHAVPGLPAGDVVYITKDAVGGMAQDVMAQKDVVVVHGQDGASVWATPVDPAAGVAVPHVMPLPAVDAWY